MLHRSLLLSHPCLLLEPLYEQSGRAVWGPSMNDLGDISAKLEKLQTSVDKKKNPNDLVWASAIGAWR